MNSSFPGEKLKFKKRTQKIELNNFSNSVIVESVKSDTDYNCNNDNSNEYDDIYDYSDENFDADINEYLNDLYADDKNGGVKSTGSGPSTDMEVLPTEKDNTSFLPNPEELTVLSGLTETQIRAVKYIVDESRKNSIQKEYELFNKIQNADHLQKLLLYIRDEAPIIIHIDIANLCDTFMKDKYYRNLFETGHSKGTNCTTSRTTWENRMFNYIYDEKTTPFDRVKYGVLNVLNDPYGVNACYSYGNSYFRLKRVRLRTSFADGDTSSATSTLSSCEYYCHILAKYNQEELNATLDVALNRKKYVNSSIISVYKEVQIHGPVDLSENVEALVVNPSHKLNKPLIIKLDKLGEKYGFNVVWMDEIV